MALNPLQRLRKLCLAFPEAHEVEAWKSPTFRVRNKMFATCADASDRHAGGVPVVWIKCTPPNQQLLVASDPDRYFVPPYVGGIGWVGVRLSQGVDWKAVQELLRDGYIRTAPARLRALLEEPEQAPRVRRSLRRR